MSGNLFLETGLIIVVVFIIAFIIMSIVTNHYERKIERNKLNKNIERYDRENKK